MVAADLLTWQGGPFEAILLDAPCSATGTIRRHPDLPFVKDGSELPSLVALQAAMLDHALGLLAPGGRLVFCTCSLLEEEGEAQLAALLERHPELTVERPTLPGSSPTGSAPRAGCGCVPTSGPRRGHGRLLHGAGAQTMSPRVAPSRRTGRV